MMPLFSQFSQICSDQLVELMHSRARRRFSRGLKRKPLALIKKLRKAKKEAPPLEKPAIVKTHLRNMIVVPEMVGSIIGVYNGKAFNQVSVAKSERDTSVKCDGDLLLCLICSNDDTRWRDWAKISYERNVWHFNRIFRKIYRWFVHWFFRRWSGRLIIANFITNFFSLFSLHAFALSLHLNEQISYGIYFHFIPSGRNQTRNDWTLLGRILVDVQTSQAR